MTTAEIEELIAAARAAEQTGGDDGIAAWRKVVRAAPAVPAHWDALARLHREAKRWNGLVKVLEEELRSIPDLDLDEKVHILHEVVAIYRDRLQLTARVASALQQLLKLRPEDHEAAAALASLRR